MQDARYGAPVVRVKDGEQTNLELGLQLDKIPDEDILAAHFPVVEDGRILSLAALDDLSLYLRHNPASRAISINCTSVVPSPISRILLSR